MPENIKKQSPTKKLFLLGSVVLVVLTAAAFFTIPSFRNLLSIFPATRPLGSDPTTILRKARELREKANYEVEYEVLAKNTLEATQSASFRRVERKHEKFARVDLYLSNVLVSQYIANQDGTYGCLNFEDGNQPPCYNLSQKLKETEKKFAALKPDWNFDLIDGWLKAKAVSATVKPDKAVVNGQIRICEEINLSLTGNSLTATLLEKLTQYFPKATNQTDRDNAQKFLNRLTVTSSTCFDRETGLPLRNERVVSIDQEKQLVGETALSLKVNPSFIKSLGSKVVLGDKDAKRNSFLKSLAEGENFYLAGENGLYIFKNGKPEAYDKELARKLGSIQDLITFQGKFYVAGNGLHSFSQNQWKEELEYLKTFNVNDLIIFGDSLYFGSGKGVFVLQKDSWQQPNASFSDLSGVLQLLAAKGKLHALTDKGVYVLDQGSWRQLTAFEKYSYGRKKLFESQDRIFLAESGRLREIDGNKIILLVERRGQDEFYDVVVFNGEVFAVSEHGIFSTRKELRLSDDVTDWVRDLIVFRGSLYAAADHGVYRLVNDQWAPIGRFSISQADVLFEFDGALYSGGVLGVYRIDGEQILPAPLSEALRFFSDGQRLYVSALENDVLHEVTTEKVDPREAFDLPANAQVKNL